MGNFEIIFKRSVAKDLRQIPKKDVAKILKRIEALRAEPRPTGVEKLSGQAAVVGATGSIGRSGRGGLRNSSAHDDLVSTAEPGR